MVIWPMDSERLMPQWKAEREREEMAHMKSLHEENVQLRAQLLEEREELRAEGGQRRREVEPRRMRSRSQPQRARERPITGTVDDNLTAAAGG